HGETKEMKVCPGDPFKALCVLRSIEGQIQISPRAVRIAGSPSNQTAGCFEMKANALILLSRCFVLEHGCGQCRFASERDCIDCQYTYVRFEFSPVVCSGRFHEFAKVSASKQSDGVFVSHAAVPW